MGAHVKIRRIMERYKILIVDDEQNVLNALKRVLHNQNYEILTADNLESAVLCLNKTKVDLIICDYRLGRDDGLKFLEEISKNAPERINILLTGHADLDMAVEAINKSIISKFIIKPWDDQSLVAEIKDLLEKKVDKILKTIKAEEIMSKFAITGEEEAELLTAAHLMMRFRVSGVPIVSLDGKLVGIITATDLFRVMGEFVKEMSSVEQLPATPGLIKDVMIKEVFTVDRKASLFEIIQIMYVKNIHTLPVMENQKLIGVIGRRDVINAFYNIF